MNMTDIKPGDLDDIVVDTVLKEAADINNAGVGKQMLFLINSGVPVEDIEAHLKEKGVRC